MATVTVGAKQATATTGVRAVIPSDWDGLAALLGRGYNFPQPDQTTVFRTGDDADIEATIFAPVREANSLKIQNSLVSGSFTTLGNNNSFGNTDRLTDSVGGQIYGAGNGSLVDYIVDNYTGLAALNQFEADMNWDDNIDFALAATNLGFSNWFMPNNNQWMSLFNFEEPKVKNYAPFNITSTRSVISSTTYATTTTRVWGFNSDGVLTHAQKTSASPKLMLFRKHF